MTEEEKQFINEMIDLKERELLNVSRAAAHWSPAEYTGDYADNLHASVLRKALK